jgi:hypothetical protein
VEAPDRFCGRPEDAVSPSSFVVEPLGLIERQMARSAAVVSKRLAVPKTLSWQ